MDSLEEGYKRAIDKIQGPMAKTDFRTEIRIFRPKKCTLLGQNHVLATTRQCCAKKKYPFPNKYLLAAFGFFLLKKLPHF